MLRGLTVLALIGNCPTSLPVPPPDAGEADGGGAASGGGSASCELGAGSVSVSLFADSVGNFGGTGEMMAMDSAGNLWLTENLISAGAPRLTEIFPDGTRVVRMSAPDLSGATGVAVDAAGNVYVGDGSGNGLPGLVGANRVMRRAADGTVSVFASVQNPYGITFDSSGDVYVASWDDKAIYRFAPDGTPKGQYGGTIPENPAGIVFDASGNLLVGGFGLHKPGADGPRVYRISPAGVVSLFSDPGMPDAYALAFDPQGQLWVTYYNSSKLLRFHADGTFDIFPGAWTADDAVSGLAFNAAGDLFLETNGGRTTANPAVIVIRGLAPPCH